MMEIVLGLFLLALGIWGLFDEYYYVLDFLKGGLPVTLMAGGLLAALAGSIPYTEKENVDDK
jgi:hypothetical protein